MRILLVDANLLVLLVVGLANQDWNKSHKSLSAYDNTDFQALKAVMGKFDTLCVTPNTLTECSNLSRQIRGQAKREISLTLGRLVRISTERHVGSIDVCEGEDYARLGLTDAVLLALMNEKVTLLTADLALQLHFSESSESMGNHDSGPDEWWRTD